MCWSVSELGLLFFLDDDNRILFVKRQDGQTLSAQGKRGALAIFPTIVLPIILLPIIEESDVTDRGGGRVEGCGSGSGRGRGEGLFARALV
jgi:hypothetical protein